MNKKVHIALAESSVIIRSGLIHVLKQIGELDIYISEISDISQLEFLLCRYKSDVLIINPSLTGHNTVREMKQTAELSRIRYVALLSSLTEPSVLESFDEVLSVYDSVQEIKMKIIKLCDAEKMTENRQELSAREKEIIVEVVKGLTNKQIAEELYLSAHTVITHRRNIANKLQIHSPAGLTIYAILNKLVRLEDIKN